MKNILLVCESGMSTSLLSNKMKEYASSANKDVHIESMPICEAQNFIERADIIMIGPRARYLAKHIEELAQNKMPVVVIDMKDFGMVNGEAVLNAALDLIGE